MAKTDRFHIHTNMRRHCGVGRQRGRVRSLRAHRAVALRQNGFFGVFPMFVPGLSWQNDAFYT
jgi:hypothetical protein